MDIKMKFSVALYAASALMTMGAAQAQMLTRAQPVSPSSQFVPVRLDSLANDKSTFSAPDHRITVNKIPFNLPENNSNNNLFLHNAGWPDWKTDPLKFTSAYDTIPKEPAAALPVVRIPVDDYSAVYVLASCENDPAYSNVLSLRIGIKTGMYQVTYHDYEFHVPRQNEKTGKNVVKVLSSPAGNIFLLRLPINGAFSQEFSTHRALDVEITKKLRLAVAMPDAARFQYRPLGLPSGVHLYGMTFERAPLRLFMQGTQTGNVFNEPQIPSFWLRLDPLKTRLKNVEVRARATDYYGNVIQFPAWEVAKTTSRFPVDYRHTLKLPVSRRGYYALTLTVESDGKVLLEKHTTFALLPKNTRKHRAESPFGVWDFSGSHYTPNKAEVVGPLYVKAGLRYGMFGFSQADRAKYGVLQGQDPSLHLRYYTDLDKGFKRLDGLIKKIKASSQTPQNWLIYHEDSISGNHVTRTPDLFTGKYYQLNAQEQAKFDKMWKVAIAVTKKVRAAFPQIKISLGNGSPQLMEEFLRHHYPADLFDFLGNESASFQRLPESQPLDFVANNPSLWMERKLLDDYGYKNKPLGQCYEIMYPNSNPGNLTLHAQADYMVRNVMHSLAWEIPQIRFGLITDVGDSYHFSNWGAGGLMFAKPNLSPKPLYAAVATMTQMLDGAKFSRIIPTGTTTIYAFEFKKPDGGFVTCVWTPNASRKVLLDTTQRQLTVTDVMYNQKVLSGRNGRCELTAGPEPVFIESARPLRIKAESATEGSLPQEKYFSISALNDASQWQLVNGQDNELDAYNFMQPRQPGEFVMKNVASFGGKDNVLQVKPQFRKDEQNWWIPQYTQLKLKQPVPIDGQPTHIGLMVNGNGGWGRVIFELEDAAGQRWISIGAEQKGSPNPWLADWLSQEEFEKLQNSPNQSAGISDWNSNDVWGRSVINFAGWHYIKFPLPGNYPGEGYHWPYTSQWRCVKADGGRGDYVVHYPLKFTALDVTSRAKVLYGTKVLSVQRPEVYLKDLIVTYGDPDTAFWKPDAGQK